MPKQSWADKHFDLFVLWFVIFVTAMIGLPLVFVINASISDPGAVARGAVFLWPSEITLDGFIEVFKNKGIWTGYRNSLFYMFFGVGLHLMFTLPAAYALSRDSLAGRKVITWFFLFTMFFSGGLIPMYLLVKELHMLNTIWAIVIPGVVNVWSLLVGQAFFRQTVPHELTESAKVDGANDFQIFFRIALPLSMPIIATLALFHGVGLWNEYFKALLYLQDRDLFSLQLILREILVVNQAGDVANSGAGDTESIAQQVQLAELIKYAVMIVSALPLLVIYPFLQRFFVKGALIGSVKE